LFINAVFWILRTGAPWRNLPPDYGDWKNTHRRFCRWRDNGIWESLLEQLVTEPDYEWLMIDASHIKVHPHTADAKGGNQGMELTKGGSIVRYRIVLGRRSNSLHRSLGDYFIWKAARLGKVIVPHRNDDPDALASITKPRSPSNPPSLRSSRHGHSGRLLGRRSMIRRVVKALKSATYIPC
jgi:hypothetical protein